MALLAFGMIVSGHEKLETIFLIGLWGFIGTSACIGWSVWLSKVMPDDTEQGGGLMVAVLPGGVFGIAAKKSVFTYSD